MCVCVRVVYAFALWQKNHKLCAVATNFSELVIYEKVAGKRCLAFVTECIRKTMDFLHIFDCSRNMSKSWLDLDDFFVR